MIPGYYKFEQLPPEVRTANKIRSKVRLDCTKYAFPSIEGYGGLTIFVNKKGQLFFYKTACRDFVEAESKRYAEWSLTNNSLNFSSIYIDDDDLAEIGYGYPNPNRLLKSGCLNPLFKYRNDGYLFRMNNDYSVIEIFIIPDGRNLINSYYQRMIDGDFDSDIAKLRNLTLPFYNYDAML